MYNVYRPLIVYVMATPFVSLARVCVRACALACVNARFFLSFGCHADAWFPRQDAKTFNQSAVRYAQHQQSRTKSEAIKKVLFYRKGLDHIFEGVAVVLLCWCAGVLVCQSCHRIANCRPAVL